ncbi:MAG: nucleotidyl transferase AbiEii/AbiGii toxin family protein, partial [Desulfobacterales bacterium]|nr:nucleotidyl transferase AbiEii/AbiGii toxin family protein [Desulfobacterales bacterium]
MYKDTKVRNSELFQILLLDNLYSLSGSDHFFFQGGTAIRWIYGGTRFSEDLFFVTHLSVDNINKIISNVSRKIHNACVAQFGPGQS